MLRRYRCADKPQLNYTLNEAQQRFTALPSVWLDNTNPNIHKLVIVAQMDNIEQVVGFCVLDAGEDKYRYMDNQQALLLRSMSVNPQYQGRGFAKKALLTLRDFCQAHLNEYDVVVLGVNYQNQTAQKLYDSVGFVRQNRTVLGVQGIQYVYEYCVR